MRSFLFILSISILFLGCEDKYGGLRPVNFGPSPAPSLTSQELACVLQAEEEHQSLNIIEAALKTEAGSKFAEVLATIEATDTYTFGLFTLPSNNGVTLLLPTNRAWEAFLEENPGWELEGESLAEFLRNHVLERSFTYQAIHSEAFIYPNFNGFLIEFNKENNGCMIINKSATFITVDDRCANGFIHTIDKVLIP